MRLRKSEPALNVGDYVSLEVGVDDVFAYTRTAPGADSFLVVLNFGTGTHFLDLSAMAARGKFEISTSMESVGEVDLRMLILSPNEGIVFRLLP